MTTENRQLQANYLRVLMVFVRNALVRELSFRSNFMITLFSRLFWFAAQIVMFDLIFRVVPQINEWTRAEYFGFMATGMLINAIVEAIFMPNCANFSEMIRTGSLDFALLKPIDTQFLVSFEKWISPWRTRLCSPAGYWAMRSIRMVSGPRDGCW